MSDSILRGRLIRLASSYEKGSPERRRILNLIQAADFNADDIGEIVPGPHTHDSDEPWMGGEFTQQEFSELREKQQGGDLDDGDADDAPMVMASEKALRDGLVRLAAAKPEFRKHLIPIITAYDKQAGCEKLPEGPMRDNCEKKKDEGGSEKKAAEYPWDDCIKDQMKEYKDKETAEKVCGKIKAESGKQAFQKAATGKTAKEAAANAYRYARSQGLSPEESVLLGRYAAHQFGR